MDSYVLAVIGADRTGLVAALSEVIAEHGGSWERSEMAEMAGMFAGMLLVRLPPERSEAFRDALRPLHERGLLDVTLRSAPADPDPPGDAPTVGFRVVGADRPGIVHELSHLLTTLGVGIVDLHTWTESAAMAGSPLFRVAATVRLPDRMDSEQLLASLEGVADDLMVDLTEGA